MAQHKIQQTVETKWRVKNYPHIEITNDLRVIDTKRGVEKPEKRNGGACGWWVAHKVFIPRSKMNNAIEKIPFEVLPFAN